MKIDPNINTSFTQQEIQTTPVDKTSVPNSADRLESFDPASQPAFGDPGVTSFNSDIAAGGSVLLGGRSEGFGLQFAAPDSPAPVSQDDPGWFFNGLSWLGGNLTDIAGDITSPIGTGIEWITDGLLDVSEGMRDGAVWFGEHAWDSISQIPDALESGAGALWHGADSAGEGVWDGAMWAANELDSAVSTGMHDVAAGMQDAASAVGNAISDALDW